MNHQANNKSLQIFDNKTKYNLQLYLTNILSNAEHFSYFIKENNIEINDDGVNKAEIFRSLVQGFKKYEMEILVDEYRDEKKFEVYEIDFENYYSEPRFKNKSSTVNILNKSKRKINKVSASNVMRSRHYDQNDVEDSAALDAHLETLEHFFQVWGAYLQHLCRCFIYRKLRLNLNTEVQLVSKFFSY